MYNNYKPLVDMDTTYGSQKKPDPFKMSDDEIKNIIHATRGAPDISFDADSLFIIVDNILTRSTQIVEDVIQTGKATSEAIDEKSPKPNFSVPLCILKQITSEISCCKDVTVEISHDVTMAILAKLANYSWKAKAALAMAALAMEFGDFLLFVELDQMTYQPIKSLSILKGVGRAKNRPDLHQQRRAVLVKLNGLVKTSLCLLRVIYELHKVSDFDLKALSVDVAVYWIIVVVVVCASKVSVLTCDDDWKKSLNISLYEKKVNFILNNLTNHLNDLRERKEYDAYCQLLRLRKIPQEAIKFLSTLFSLKESDAKIIDGSNGFMKVRINVFENKNIIFFISRKKISSDDVYTMNLIQTNKIMKENNQYKYAIVWVPVLEEGEKFEDFESVARANHMSWYVMMPVSHSLGRRFLKEEWHFKSETTAVAYSVVEGRETNINAYHTIKTLGLDAFPFDAEFWKLTPDAADWIVPLFSSFTDQSAISKINKWVKKESYIFYHGGRDKQWSTQITGIINTFLKTTAAVSGGRTITIKRFDVEDQTAEFKNEFWRGVQDLFLSKVSEEDDSSGLKPQIGRLFSYRSEDTWFVFGAGAATMAVGDRFTLSVAAEELARKVKWGENRSETKAFHAAFVETHEKVSREHMAEMRCSRIEVPSAVGRLPEKIGCPVCRARMDVVTSYVCCHASADHHH